MLAIYRKYRPKTLSDIFGQETVIELLKNAGRLDRLAHAYLFYGPKGSGKTTVARIIAKIANCQKRIKDENFKKTGEPCNECQSCIETDKGLAIDVIEIDAASNRGIDEIRNLKESIRVSPSLSAKKIYIIDEAHQLTKDAFNALLKTLEEPPAHAILILVTTETEKMPATIISRTQRFHFKKIPLKTITEKLKNIAKAEKIGIEDEAIELISETAGGSMRDAESLLDQIASLTQAEDPVKNKIKPEKTSSLKNKTKADKIKKITVINVEEMLGSASFSRISKLAELLIKRDLKNGLKNLSEINEGGYNLIQFNKDLIHYFRRILALKFSPELENQFSKELTDQELKIIKNHSQLIDAEKTVKLMKSLIESYTEMRYSPFTIVPLEVAIIENLK